MSVFLEEKLPPSFFNEVETISSSAIVLRSSVKSLEECNKWVKEFGELTNTRWNSRTTRPNGQRFACSKKFVCHHSAFMKVPAAANKRSYTKNSDCRATINIKVKLDTKTTKKNDPFVQKGLLAVIAIKDAHNHSLNTVEALKFLPPAGCKDKFIEYFNDGMGIAEACKYHEDILQEENSSEDILYNSQINPPYRSVQYWHDQWRLQNLGPRTDQGPIEVVNLDDLDIELLIAEVKRYPELWNIAAENYSDQTKKRGAWVSVCRVFCDGFDEKEDKDKNELCSALIKKWRNIKDNYMKSVKKEANSGQAADSGRLYIYAQQLSFLQTASDTTETQSSLSSNDREEVLEQSDDKKPLQIETQLEEPKHTPSYEQKSSIKRKCDVESSSIDFTETPVPSVATVPEPNTNRSFFESILPSISDFTEDQKLEFRCEILNLIKRMRMSSHPQSYGYSP